MKQKSYTQLTTIERQEISLYLREGKSYRRIAQLLGRSANAISYEVQRNTTRKGYDWHTAEAKIRVRRHNAKYQGMKLRKNPTLCSYVEEKLRVDWSPEEIAGRLRNIEREQGYVSFRTIYRYVGTVWGEKFKKHLRYQGRGHGNNTKTKPLDDRVRIDMRPKEAEKRRVFGHWEADFIVSGRKGKGALLVFVERKTRYVLIFKLRDRKVETINGILERLLGAHLIVKTLTIDNDVCFRQHKAMSVILKAPIYFCHPYHSWEKGTVENMNKWIRQYVKKGSNISAYSETYIRFVQDRLNNRPRKCLQYKTPAEVFLQEQRLQQTVDSMLVSTKKHRVCECPT